MLTTIISDSQPSIDVIRRFLASHGWEFRVRPLNPVNTLLKELPHDDAQNIMLVLPDTRQRHEELIHSIRQATSASLIVIGPADPKLILHTLHQIGADHYLDVSDLATELECLLERIESTEPGKVIVVMSPHPGSGSTTVAVNLAMALKDQGTGVLIDFDLVNGDASCLLDLRPERTIADFSRNLTRMDKGLFLQLLELHEPSGCRVLAAPKTIDESTLVTTDAAFLAISMARGLFGHVVVDLGHSMSPTQLEALRLADCIVMVVDLNFTSVRQVTRVLEHLRKHTLDTTKVKLIVNRYGQPKQISARQAEKLLQQTFVAYLPEDERTVNKCNNRGTPLVLATPRSSISRQIKRLVAALNGVCQ